MAHDAGDLDPGAPELRADSRYNRDNDFLARNYAASADILVVMVATPEDQCTRYDTLARVDRLAWRLEQLPGVEATHSMAALSKLAMVGYNEGQLKWFELIPNAAALGGVQARAPRELFNQGCSFLSLYVYLQDHKAATLTRVVDHVEAFAADLRRFLAGFYYSISGDAKEGEWKLGLPSSATTSSPVSSAKQGRPAAAK